MKKLKKKIAFFLSGISVFIIVIALTITPFIGLYQAIIHPISTTVDFITSIIGDVSDIFDYDNISNKDINLLITTFYERSEYKDLIDNIVSQYPDCSIVTPENILKPFIFTQCKEINETTLNQVALFISKSMKNSYDTKLMIEYILSTSPFNSNKDINEDYLAYLFNGNNNSNNEYHPEDNSSLPEKIVGYAKSKLGARYWWGASGPTYFDCSGLIYWTHLQAGIKIPRTTASGYSKMGMPLPYSKLQPGDIITFDYGHGVAHVGIYIGNGNMIHASGHGQGTVGQYPEQCVKISSVKTGSYFYKNIYNCRRLLGCE